MTLIPYIVVQNHRDGMAIIFDLNSTNAISNDDDVELVVDSNGTHIQIGGGLLQNLPEDVIENIHNPDTNLKIFEMDSDNISRAWVI